MDSEGGMQLIRAVQSNRKKEVQKLLKNSGVLYVNFTDSYGKSALYYAIEENYCEIVEILLRHGADIYIKDFTNKIVADYVIEILSNDEKREIVNLIKEKILKDSVAILEAYHEKSVSTESAIEESPEEHEHPKNNVYKKIKALSKRLENPRPSKYEAANTFLLFLEVFCTETSSLLNIRHALLKKKNLTPEILINVIEYCSPEFNSDDHTYHTFCGKKIKFFIRLSEFLKNVKDNEKLTGINNLFNYQIENENQVNSIINSREVDQEEIDDEFKDQLKSWIVKAYSNKIDTEWEQLWFDFNLNIYPHFINEVSEQYKDLLQKQMTQLRDDFVYSTEQVSKKNWIQNFKEFIIKIKGKLLEYFYAQTLHEMLTTYSLTCGLNKMKKNINKNFESIRDEVLCDREWVDSFAMKFEKSLFPTLSDGLIPDQSLIEEYFSFIPTVEYLNESVRDKNSNYYNTFDGSEKILGAKLLDDRSRRCFFEQYVNAKRYEEREDHDNYKLEKKSLINGLSEYGIDKECVENIFQPHLDEKISSAVSSLVKQVYYFIHDLKTVNEIVIEAKEIDIVTFVEYSFRATTDRDLPQLPKALITKNPNWITNIKKRHDGIFTIDNIAGIDVKANIRTMFKTFYDAFNEYRIVSSVEDLFKRETFLNALFHMLGCEQDELSIIIKRLLKVDYMAPFIAKIIDHLKNNKINESNFKQIKALINEDSMKKLILYLAKEECLHYLSILLTIEFDKYDPYGLLLDFVEEKEIALECIDEIFDNFVNIKGFADALSLKQLVGKNWDDDFCHDYTETVIIPFLKIINLKVKEQFSRARCYYNNRSDSTNTNKQNEEYNKARERLKISEDLEKEFSGEALPACHEQFIGKDLLEAEISNEQKIYSESQQFFSSALTEKLNRDLTNRVTDRCTNYEHREAHHTYELLIRLIKFQILKADHLRDSMKIRREVSYYENILVDFNELFSTIVNKFCNKTAEFKNFLCIYEKIVDDETYKNLLATSKLLCSEKYFNINNIALNLTFFIWLKYRAGMRSSDVTDCELQNTLSMLENVYIRRKNNETVEFFRHVATIYEGNINRQELLSNIEINLIYCLKALTRFNMYNNQKESSAIVARNGIEKNVLDILHDYLSIQYKRLKWKDANFNRLEVLTKVRELCTQLLKFIDNCSTKKELRRYYLKKFLKLSADACEGCGFHSKVQRKSLQEWKNFYYEAIDYSKRLTDLHNNEDECCTESIEAIKTMESVLEKYDEAESFYKQWIDRDNLPLSCKKVV